MIVLARIRFVNDRCNMFRVLERVAGVSVRVLGTKLVNDTVVHLVEIRGGEKPLREAYRVLGEARNIRFQASSTGPGRVVALIYAETCRVCRLFHGVHRWFTLSHTLEGGRVSEAVVVAPLKEVEALVETLKGLVKVVDVEYSRPISEAFLTEHQRRVLREAVAAGYYEIPRRANLDDLARRLGISRSSVADALRRAEAKAVRLILRLDEELRQKG